MSGFQRDTPASHRVRLSASDHGARPRLRFLGLFDTVASLHMQRFTAQGVHVLRLPMSAKYIAHAIALNENRAMFQSVRFPEGPPAGVLIERWFSGAHANVGGGYPFDPVALLPLAWMLRQAKRNGLVLRAEPRGSKPPALATPERHSFAEFAGGSSASSEEQMDLEISGDWSSNAWAGRRMD